jgi:predicted protein tyrosine phosphatase
MKARLDLQEKHRLLKEALDESLKKKRLIEVNIGEQFEALKKFEISLEKTKASPAVNGRTSSGLSNQSKFKSCFASVGG